MARPLTERTRAAYRKKDAKLLRRLVKITEEYEMDEAALFMPDVYPRVHEV
jgi:hypothetical protein